MSIITRADFTAHKEELVPVRRELVELNENVSVYVTELTALAAMNLDREKADEKNAVLAWVSACVVDENGESILTIEDVKHLPAAMFSKLAKSVLELNGLANSDKVVGEAEKNSETVA